MGNFGENGYLLTRGIQLMNVNKPPPPPKKKERDIQKQKQLYNKYKIS